MPLDPLDLLDLTGQQVLQPEAGRHIIDLFDPHDQVAAGIQPRKQSSDLVFL